MTAIVGVLNRHAVAIAADSAMTMGGTHKVINSANKIFTLSKYHPVAVMTYSNAAFMGVPWDIIIKEYRKQLGTRSFPMLKEYMDDFISFLHKRHFFCEEKTQRDYMVQMLDRFVSICQKNVSKSSGAPMGGITNAQLNEEFKDCKEVNMKTPVCTGFKGYSYESFSSYAKASIMGYAKENKIADVNLLIESFFYYLAAEFPKAFYTGLVFVGYGEDEIYPSLYPINVSLGMDNHLCYYLEEARVANIGEQGSDAVIAPFAQVDVTQTIIRGINPGFQNIIYETIGKMVGNLKNIITTFLDSDPTTKHVSDTIKKFDFSHVIKEATNDINKNMNESYTQPLLNTIMSLDKEDMANMAESFISLTSLVRRMQPAEETVGGPVDVAVISKGDGFVWIKRKHYFKPEYNAPFFSNYFNNGGLIHEDQDE